MNIIIKTKNLEISEQLKNVINHKIGGLKKFLNKFKKDKNVSFDTFVYVGKETTHHKKGDIFETEVKIVLHDKNLVAKSHGESLLKTITKVKKEIEREIRKYKTKIIELPRRKYRKSIQLSKGI
ncbi:MAG: ribosome-associated translation inhibitor RaiA [Nanoarchaeota archaeon]